MITIYDYTTSQALSLAEMGRHRTSETYLSALRSLMHFCDNPSLRFSQLDAAFIGRYEAWLRGRHLCRNSTSFYMRILRRIYNLAVADGLAPVQSPFLHVYTGIDKTSKRAISAIELRRLKVFPLPPDSPLLYARDMFLLSFYLRGMSFIDMAFLRKSDLRNGYISYSRRKTGQLLSIRWEEPMQHIVNRYSPSFTSYLLPILQREDGTERRQYLNKQLYVNRKLKVLGRMAELSVPLTMYVARHSWASIAHNQNIPLSVISEGLGHDSENTTRIYLSSVESSQVDEANRRILQII